MMICRQTKWHSTHQSMNSGSLLHPREVNKAFSSSTRDLEPLLWHKGHRNQLSFSGGGPVGKQARKLGYLTDVMQLDRPQTSRRISVFSSSDVTAPSRRNNLPQTNAESQEWSLSPSMRNSTSKRRSHPALTLNKQTLTADELSSPHCQRNESVRGFGSAEQVWPSLMTVLLSDGKHSPASVSQNEFKPQGGV